MKLIKSLIILGTIATASAYAAAPGFFVGATAGYGMTHTGSATIKNNMLSQVGDDHVTTFSSSKNNKFAFGAAVGYNFNQYVGLQLGYNNFGSNEFVANDGKTTTKLANPKFYDIDLMVNGYMSLSDNFSLVGQAGMAYVKGSIKPVSKVPGVNPAAFALKTVYTPKIAAGIAYSLQPGMDLMLTYSHIFQNKSLQKVFDNEVKKQTTNVKYAPNLDMIGLTFNYSFGNNM